MKKILILLLCLLLTASITGCGTQSIKPIDTIEGNMKTYEYQKARGIKIHPGLWKDMRVDIFLVKKEN